MARRVIFYAQEEAQRFGEGYVSTEHLLLGLTRDPETTAAKALERLGLSLNRIRAELEKQLPKGDARPSQDMTLTPRAKRVIDLAYEEARALSNNYIGTEHLFLGLIREGDGLAGRVLAKLGAELEKARAIVVELQASQEAEGPPKQTAPPVPIPKSKERQDPRAALRSKLVFVYGSGPIVAGLDELLPRLGLVPLSWAQARIFTGQNAPTTSEVVNTAFAVGGAIVFVFGAEADPSLDQGGEGSDVKDGFQDQLFAAGTAFALETRKTILVAAEDVVAGEGLQRHLLGIDNGKESRQALVDALKAAGCPVDTSGEEWLSAGDFGGS